MQTARHYALQGFSGCSISLGCRLGKSMCSTATGAGGRALAHALNAGRGSVSVELLLDAIMPLLRFWNCPSARSTNACIEHRPMQLACPGNPPDRLAGGPAATQMRRSAE